MHKSAKQCLYKVVSISDGEWMTLITKSVLTFPIRPGIKLRMRLKPFSYGLTIEHNISIKERRRL